MVCQNFMKFDRNLHFDKGLMHIKSCCNQPCNGGTMALYFFKKKGRFCIQSHILVMVCQIFVQFDRNVHFNKGLIHIKYCVAAICLVMAKFMALYIFLEKAIFLFICSCILEIVSDFRDI